MKVLITGGAGFIGSHIVDQALEAGYEVCVIDDLSTGKKMQLNPQAAFYEMNIASPDIQQVFKNEKPDFVIHQAAQSSVPVSVKNAVGDAMTNIVGTVNLLEAARQYGVRKFVYASSAAVYGEPQYMGIDEAHPKHPLSPYGVSKYVPEFYLDVYRHLYGLTYTAFRYANVYGERQDPKGEGGVVSIFVDRALAGQELVVFGDGEQTRDFVYVQDVARANIMALAGGDNEILNISTNQETSVNQLIQLMNEVLGTTLAVKYKAPREGDIVNSYLDNTKATEKLGWKPQYSLRQGLEKTLHFYQMSK
ncbi:MULTISPECIES: SDR family oxidoreductase [Aneurinibacillus]|uniref:SDR family oxidoreductase n=1 Tax=Aneurinibacillus thermoaerophilus TaxID=143495 RepID=A0A1G8D734_ANETH|nr:MULTISPECIES: SDR family oxidoreductase [Aneurinibacillus]AMA72038.1 UDP-glucose 4-epimerase [Aneurinibacillus sp. XH2]MED0679321.1 SDR family oxidoreductase [Aneurinibacillus thermoaerophilus]MED0737207.1 SDR family oxidoreductase [Aneurinibacillus thermoaerophilus]MED0757253.1 SDR family oxidoreductase [Aneurinibacillus thermoaerophilus]MED0762423.1 SDR family oxidoreductase [Aneurinibacillus thermoaerophilus]